MAEQVAQGIRFTAATQQPAYSHTESGECVAMASLRAPQYEPQARSAVDIVAVIDRSGSMEGTKLSLVRKTLLFMIDQLKPCDRLGLVLYDDVVEVDFPLTYMDKDNKEMTKNKVSKIQDRSATNLCGGLLKGMEQIINRSGEKAKVASVLLFTDGLANRGITHPSEILAAMRDPIGFLAKPGVLEGARPVRHLLPNAGPRSQFANLIPVNMPPVQNISQAPSQQIPIVPPPSFQQQNQVQFQLPATPPEPPAAEPMDTAAVDFEGTVYTFGLGSDHNADLLTAISNAGNGVYYYIDSTEKIAECFADCLGGLLSVVGQNITLTIEAQPSYQLGGVRYKNKPQMSPDGTKCVVSLGDLQSEEERDIIVPIKLSPLPAEAIGHPLATFTLSYFNVITALMHTTTCELTADRRTPDAGMVCNDAITVQMWRVRIAQCLEEARTIAPLDLHQAKSMLVQCREELLKTAVAKDKICVALVADLNTTIAALQDQHTYTSRGSHTIASIGQQQMAQRSNVSPMYMNASKSAMRAHSKNIQ